MAAAINDFFQKDREFLLGECLLRLNPLAYMTNIRNVAKPDIHQKSIVFAPLIAFPPVELHKFCKVLFNLAIIIQKEWLAAFIKGQAARKWKWSSLPFFGTVASNVSI